MLTKFLSWLAIAVFIAAFWFVFALIATRSMDWAIGAAVVAFIGSMSLGAFFVGRSRNMGGSK